MLQYGAPKYFEVIWKKERQKKREKTREKKTHSGFHTGFKHLSCGNSLKAMISFHILKFA